MGWMMAGMLTQLPLPLLPAGVPRSRPGSGWSPAMMVAGWCRCERGVWPVQGRVLRASPKFPLISL